MRFMTHDGTELVGRSYEDIVARMADEKLTRPRNLEGYRRATAQRVSDLYKVQIDASDDRSFIQSLVASGVLQQLP